MNEITFLKTIKALLIAQTWGAPSNAVVFPSGSVAVSLDDKNTFEYAMRNFRTPWAVIVPGPARCDPVYDEQPDFLYSDIKIRIAVSIPGDPIGENALLGANPTNTSSPSEGAGLLTIEQQIYLAVGLLVESGVVIQFRQRGIPGGMKKGESSWIQYRDLSFEMIGTLV